MEPVPRRKPGVTMGDIGSLMSTLFHAAVVLIGLGLLAFGLLAWLFGGIAGALGLD